ncbi:copper resistance protein CopC [Siccirubricoccus sp. KC 17139]|uniref:Copper resistance protein CopC n=1 Tax=Siccirubricoccus soli TaxID=2899147 RepID=A0ABT1D1N8_9PROT|nr:copper resistance CopC family protein [Siccirubricoccus soli]MCO6415824.1 copper resistance protein CopC [Siccirubricoccus soli]MCP2681956.1 copper resistance protein CopC [Siccirubricoccus soli]
MTAPLPRCRALVAAATALGLAAMGPALAHSELHHAEPADGAVLRGSPPAISLMFAMPVRVMTLKLLDEAGREKKLAREGERSAAVEEVRATVQETLPPGGYRIEWRGASADGHVGGGTLAFRVERAAR